MRVLLGVCGGIAAYKAAELTRELRRGGAEVQVAMTGSAQRFVTPLTFASLSGRQVLSSLWQPEVSESNGGEPEPFDIEHIRCAQEADVFLIAPATAHFLTKLAHGFADDVLSTACLATTAPLLLVAPAMNTAMWNHPATQQNLNILRQRRVLVIAPEEGLLACGSVGLGRMASPVEIAERVFQIFRESKTLSTETILITAGGTREPIDAVRFIGNRSSGKMGFALAEAALARGARVVLISTVPSGIVSNLCEEHHVDTASEMHEAVLAHLQHATVVLMAAAVADYQLEKPVLSKRKKTGRLVLDLAQTKDILTDVARLRAPGTIVVGFAAETEDLLEEGRRKLHAKDVDAIVANDVSQPGFGFDSDRNQGTLITEKQEIELPPSSKREMAEKILDHVESLRT